MQLFCWVFHLFNVAVIFLKTRITQSNSSMTWTECAWRVDVSELVYKMTELLSTSQAVSFPRQNIEKEIIFPN